MNDGHDKSGETRHGDGIQGPPWSGSGWVFGLFWLLLWLGSFGGAAPWDQFHAVLLAAGGAVLMVSAKRVALPRGWWLLAALFVVAAAAPFLPAAWFPLPAWRGELERLGVATGDRVVIQTRQALENYGLLVIMLLGGLLMIGHRPSRGQLRTWSLVFVTGVAVYAVISKLNLPPKGENFGFFPNRNHTSTLLAMGAICGLGCSLQAARDRGWVRLALALAATAICVCAAMSWTISRAGVVLIGVGAVIWLPMLGVRYLGKHGVWAISLIGLLAAGGFVLTDSVVKERLTKTIEKIETIDTPVATASGSGDQSLGDAAGAQEFRIPTMLDTWDMILQHPWPGVGAGQFRWIFPQYRHRSALGHKADHLHPESDWLWLAAELGLPAAVLLLALTLWALGYGAASVMRGHDRALRSACLAAAALVPLHGVFDVPGHRIALAWTAAWLFAMALRPPRTDPLEPAKGGSRLRLAALPVIGVAAWFGWLGWHGMCAMTAGDKAVERAYAIIAALQSMNDDERAASQPFIEGGIQEIDHALALSPLHRGAFYMRGFLSVNIEEMDADTDRAFTRLRALHPTGAELVVEQSMAWSGVDPARVEALWVEALRRAALIDRRQPPPASNRDYALHLMRTMVAKRPELEPIYARIAANSLESGKN